MLSVTMAALNAAQKEMNVTSNNLANASTVGFKRSYANFGDVFSNDPASNPKTAVGAGVLLTSVARDTTAGALKSTGRVTDLAIDGRGYFITRDPAGTANTYSRAGNFSIDASGYIIDPGGFRLMGYKASSGTNLIPIQAKPQFNFGDTLPDGSVVGQEVQLVSLKGPATATGPITVGGVSVLINRGDTTAQMAQKVQTALTNNQAFAGRTVTTIGTGDTTQVKIAFGVNETNITPVDINVPPAVSPSVSVKSAYGNYPEIQSYTYDQLINDRGPWTQNFHMKDGIISVSIVDGQNWATNSRDGLNDPKNAALMAGAVASVDPNNPLKLLITFDVASGKLVPVENTGSTGDGSFLVEEQAGGLHPKVEEMTFQTATSDMTADVGGVSVDILKGDTPNVIANKISSALQTAFPQRTVTVDGDKINMTYTIAEGDAPLVQPKYTNKQAATGTVAVSKKANGESIILQNLSISPKGEVSAIYSDGQTYNLGNIGIASFANDGGLKAIGNNRYAETGLSGAASLTLAGAPKAGNIMTGALEQANVDITSELMDMIRSQQVYNGNARMLQTTLETVSRITDKI